MISKKPLQPLKNKKEHLFFATLGRSGPLLGHFWPLLGRSWRILEHSWGPLGSILERLGGILGKISKNRRVLPTF